MPMAVTTRPPTRSPSGEKHTLSFQLDLELAGSTGLAARATVRRSTSDVASESPTRPCFQSGGHWDTSTVPFPLENLAELGRRIEGSKVAPAVGGRTGRSKASCPRRLNPAPVRGGSNESRRREAGADHRGWTKIHGMPNQLPSLRRPAPMPPPVSPGSGRRSGHQGAVSRRGLVRLER